MPISIEVPDKPTLYFIGVSTSQSSIMKVFPEWVKALNLEAQIKGIDIALDAPPEDYRQAVEHIQKHAMAKGALVTTHKIDLFNASEDLFSSFDFYAELCGELSCISKRGDELLGFAKDPISSGLTLKGFIAETHWQDTNAELLCLGAGGAAVAISLYLAQKEDKPKRIIIVDINQERLEHIRAIHKNLETSIVFEYRLHKDASENDALLAQLPEGSLIINATGMGKDRPGSPLSNQAEFPSSAIVWELNYRGALDFFHQAKVQQDAKRLSVQDGWVYFLHGWTQVMTEVFQFDLSQTQFEELGEIASAFR